MGKKKVNSSPRYKVVLDTNVFISAVLFSGPTSRLVALWQKGTIIVLISIEVLKEYAKVLAYPKFKLKKEEIKAILEQEILPYIKPVKIRKNHHQIVRDPSDNKFLTLAFEGKADYLLSGDKHLLALETFRSINIITVEEFLAILL